MDDEIDPAEVESLLDGADAPRVVDIRSPETFDRGHIPGSENVPFAELPDRVADFEGEERIVTVCPHGKASVQAARLIGSYEGTADARVESMRGGLEAWEGPLDAAESDDEAGADGEATSADEGPDAPF
ncbi:rhodanese-like domain-containing protein [Halogeometricum luteum]|uniref:Rhodanese-like domain-containing protein n=1 Tax=Halogeometricum luteum TaxID=2950537 RepID=A0ABU2G160_9EURY|nr:rhodanese-like domain-containing protein [Halogeometricum sp. S3BR5-2]MDS0294028.1 rhodanese-like domain-containing protein [Halogeometricum sp. S3BR5-2]